MDDDRDLRLLVHGASGRMGKALLRLGAEQPGDPDAAALSEDEIADFLCRRIENGELAAEDIPVRLARYGLMQPLAFVEEMRERMASEKGG